MENVQSKVIGYDIQPNFISIMVEEEELGELKLTQSVLNEALPFDSDEGMNANLMLLCDSTISFHVKGNDIIDFVYNN